MGDLNDAFLRNQNAAVQARAKAQNRANVVQLKLIGQSHPTGLTSNLLKLFEPRPPLEYKPAPEKRKPPPYTGMAHFVTNFAEPGDPEYAPPPKKAETSAQRRARVHQLRLESGVKKAAEELEKYDPSNDPNVSGDPYKTLFVARLNYETTEHRLKREFEAYGPIKRVRMVTDKQTNKPRGYAFIEYAHTRDMKGAYKQADGRKLDNRRVLVDVERGRTVPNWRPRRLGGGLGSTRVGGEEVNQKYSGREPQTLASGGPSRSEEPRAREDRHIERVREVSRERGREQDRDKSRERGRSHDKPREREPREERHHHRDRDRTKDRDRDRDRDHGRDHERSRDRDRGRDRGRDKNRDREHGRDNDRERDRPRERERDYDKVEPDHESGRSRDRDADYDRSQSKHGRDRHGEKVPEADPEHGKYDPYEQDQSHYEHIEEPEGDRDHDRYEQTKTEECRYDRAVSEPREREDTGDHELGYRRSKRSLSREYED